MGIGGDSQTMETQSPHSQHVSSQHSESQEEVRQGDSTGDYVRNGGQRCHGDSSYWKLSWRF
jgi:hypothetical protein